SVAIHFYGVLNIYSIGGYNYVLHNYIENHCQFLPNIWTEIPSLSPNFLTTNAAESFHPTYNSQLHSPHPHVHAVVSRIN
ncbi:Uncharacterized protein FWK35_00019996, partial [Aphis craccivora]